MTRPSVIVLSYRIGLTVRGGEWNLIHSRNEGLIRSGCDVRMLCGLPGGVQIPEHLRNSHYPIDVITAHVPRWARLSRLLSYRWVAREVSLAMVRSVEQHAPSAVIISGDHCVPPLLRALPCNQRLVLDIHGSYEEGLEYGSRLRRLTLPRLRHRTFAKRWFPRFDAAFVVSNELGDEARSLSPNLKTFTVPCSCVEAPNWHEVARNRVHWRREFHVGEQELLLAHSGGLGLYQSPEPMLRLLSAAIADGIPTKLLMLTRYPELMKTVLQHEPEGLRRSVLITHFADNEYLAALAAADAGLLLRDGNATNRAAFPNKTDEFWSVGVPVITTVGLRPVARLVDENGAAGRVLQTWPGSLDANDLRWIAALRSQDNTERKERFENIRPLRERISFTTALRPFMTYLAGRNDIS